MALASMYSMPGSRNAVASVLVFLVLALSGSVSQGARFKVTLHNNCQFPVWPAWVPETPADQQPLCPGGTFLNTSQKYTLYPSTRWSGTFWARTGCTFNRTTGHGTCETGDCGGSFGCRSMGKIPITRAEFVPDPSTFSLKYHVSLLSGFNVPLGIATELTSVCRHVGCPCDITQSCPEQLDFNVRDHKVGCFSPCDKFGNDTLCCRGAFAGDACKPNEYSALFKATCGMSASYVLTFCPDETHPSSPPSPPPPPPPPVFPPSRKFQAAM